MGPGKQKGGTGGINEPGYGREDRKEHYVILEDDELKY